MAIASRVAKEYNIDLQGLDASKYSVNTSSNDSGISWEDIAVVIILILIFIIFGRGGRNIRRDWWGPGSFGSGGFGGFRGGGFGGGGFGGGEASAEVLPEAEEPAAELDILVLSNWGTLETPSVCF